ncbi:hypothetical protein FQR65_LT15883 [Abscondita terminalis]|nr:hypothetical protein FQR65_LT15883 [Abscondita terminalis]
MKTILVANLKGGCGKTITAITLATALAQKGYKVALADADGQKSALQWLKQRPEQAAKIQSLDWRHEKSIGDAPKNLDYLVIDAPGALLYRRFLKHIQDIKKIRKGKVAVHLIANRMKANSASSKDIQQFFEKIDQQPVAWISERTAYGQLAMQGLNIFDKTQKNFLTIQEQWQPLLDALIDDPSDWF